MGKSRIRLKRQLGAWAATITHSVYQKTQSHGSATTREVVADDSHATARASDSWTDDSSIIEVGPSADESQAAAARSPDDSPCLTGSDEDEPEGVLNKVLTAKNDGAAFRRILDALTTMERDIKDAGATGHISLELDYIEEQGPPDDMSESYITITSEGWYYMKRASWPVKRLLDGSLHLAADIRHDDHGNMHVKMAMTFYGSDETESYSRECRGPIATISELSTLMVRYKNSDCDSGSTKCFLFLRTLCGVVARAFPGLDSERTAKDRWVAAATGAWEAVETETSLQKAMSDVWDASRLSPDCPSCERRNDCEGPKRLIEMATGELVEAAKGCEYAAVSYCWGSVTGDEELWAQVGMAVRNTPISHVWIDRFCLSSDPATRQYEVHHMAEIYANARLVLILPGTQITELDNMHFDANGTAVQVNKENIQRIGEQWTQTEWRSRCWTFQEATMARATAVVTGSRKKPVLSGAALDALATSTSGSNVKLVPWHPLDNTLIRVNLHMYEAEWSNKYYLFTRSYRVCGACGLPQNKSPRAQKQPLLALMGLSWNRKATKELDTVYSLLSMAKDGYKIPVRYDITMEELYEVLIETRVVGAEILALGGGFAGSTSATCWMPNRGKQSPYGGEYFLFGVGARITRMGTLRAEVLAVKIWVEERGVISFEVRAKARFPGMWDKASALVWTGAQLEDLSKGWPEGWQYWQANVLAPLTYVRRVKGGVYMWKILMVFSSGTGSLRHIEKIRILDGTSDDWLDHKNLARDTVEFG